MGVDELRPIFEAFEIPLGERGIELLGAYLTENDRLKLDELKQHQVDAAAVKMSYSSNYDIVGKKVVTDRSVSFEWITDGDPRADLAFVIRPAPVVGGYRSDGKVVVEIVRYPEEIEDDSLVSSKEVNRRWLAVDRLAEALKVGRNFSNHLFEKKSQEVTLIDRDGDEVWVTECRNAMTLHFKRLKPSNEPEGFPIVMEPVPISLQVEDNNLLTYDLETKLLEALGLTCKGRLSSGGVLLHGRRVVLDGEDIDRDVLLFLTELTTDGRTISVTVGHSVPLGLFPVEESEVESDEGDEWQDYSEGYEDEESGEKGEFEIDDDGLFDPANEEDDADFDEDDDEEGIEIPLNHHRFTIQDSQSALTVTVACDSQDEDVTRRLEIDAPEYHPGDFSLPLISIEAELSAAMTQGEIDVIMARMQTVGEVFLPKARMELLLSHPPDTNAEGDEDEPGPIREQDGAVSIVWTKRPKLSLPKLGGDASHDPCPTSS